MIAVSLKDGEELVDLLLRKDADVNAKSEFIHPLPRLSSSNPRCRTNVSSDFTGQVSFFIS